MPPAPHRVHRKESVIISVNFMLVMASADPSLLEAPTGDAAREIGPGFAGFVATALMVIAVIFLIRDMVRRIRRVRYQGEAEQRQSDLVERGRQYGQDDEDETGSGSAGTRGPGTGDAGTDDAGHGGGQTPRT